MITTNNLAAEIISGRKLNIDEASQLINLTGIERYALFLEAAIVRDHYFGSMVSLCSIINAKSGRCPENCAFCAQSSHHKSDVPVYPLVSSDKIVSAAIEARKGGSGCFGIVTSGTTVSDKEIDSICFALEKIKSIGVLEPSCSLGIISFDKAKRLKEAGAVTYHHNLETSRSFFSTVCTTHDYDEDIETIRNVKSAGLKVCSGGIFGMGETAMQRVEMAMTLRELEVDSVPLNFLNPIKGTRLENSCFITPMECLSTIAIYRLILPERKIAVCGGREYNLRDLQSWMFFAGASGTMIGNYLTTAGRKSEDDILMLKDLEMEGYACGDY